jgi:hypothetical protein
MKNFNSMLPKVQRTISQVIENKLLLNLFFLFLLICFVSKSSAQVVEWQRSYTPPVNASDEDWFYDMKPSYNSGVQDGYIACGYAGSGVVTPIEDDITSPQYDELHTSTRKKGTSHHLITKLDLNGNVVWYVNNTSRGEFLSKVIQTSDGNYVVTGTTTTVGLEKYNPVASNTAGVSYTSTKAQKRGYLAKYDQNGSLLWEYTYGLVSSSLPAEAAEHSVQLWNLLETEDGGIMSVGYGIDGHTYPHYLENDDSSYTSEMNLIAIFKTNANGILQWKKAIGGYTDMKAYGISRLGSDYIITGGALEENVGTHAFTTGSTL